MTREPAMNPSSPRLAVLARAIPAILALTVPPTGVAGAQARFDEAGVFFELNSTDRDVGLHAFFDAEGWKDVRIDGPGGRRVFAVQAEGPSRQIGITELRFEGEEPNVRDVPFSRLRTLFPPEQYLFRGTTIDNRTLRGVDELTSQLPCPTRIIAPAEGSTVPLGPLTVRWTAPPGVFNPDNQTCDRQRDVELVGFELTVEFASERAGVQRALTVQVPRGAREFQVPRSFLAEGARLPGTEFSVEVLAVEDSENKTITKGNFRVRP